MNAAIVLAGGTGTRIGADVPKQFIQIQGKPILAYTLGVYQENENIDAIEVVCHRDWVEEVQRIQRDYGIGKLRWITLGGETFQESTLNGIMNLREVLGPEDTVSISFGVSPMTTQESINDGLRVSKLHGNAIASDDIILCTCIKDDEESSSRSILRESLKAFSNPWTFQYGELLEAYETAIREGFLQELEPHTTSLYLALGKRIYFSKSSPLNFKITSKEDLDIFEGLLLLKRQRETHGRNDT